ncbi:MAG: GTP 3',8-cyclase MoaA, partial [Sulfolobus sp.]|nr:GTP 3',8-cyclase MoaA [Sulfolobus sp.]
RDLTEIISELKSSGIREVSMTTNGILLPILAWKLKDAGLDRVNVSLHALERDLFKKITGVDALNKVIEGIRAAIEAGLKPVKLNYVFTSENLSELQKIIEFAEKVGVDEIHLIEMHPVGLGKLAFKYHKDLNEIEKELEKIAVGKEIRKKHLRPRYKLPSGLVVEVVKPYANPIFCAGCNRIRLTADGFLKTCLYRNDKSVEIIEILRGNYSEEEKLELLKEAFELAITIREPNFKYSL